MTGSARQTKINSTAAKPLGLAVAHNVLYSPDYWEVEKHFDEAVKALGEIKRLSVYEIETLKDSAMAQAIKYCNSKGLSQREIGQITPVLKNRLDVYVEALLNAGHR